MRDIVTAEDIGVKVGDVIAAWGHQGNEKCFFHVVKIEEKYLEKDAQWGPGKKGDRVDDVAFITMVAHSDGSPTKGNCKLREKRMSNIQPLDEYIDAKFAHWDAQKQKLLTLQMRAKKLQEMADKRRS